MNAAFNLLDFILQEKKKSVSNHLLQIQTSMPLLFSSGSTAEKKANFTYIKHEFSAFVIAGQPNKTDKTKRQKILYIKLQHYIM